MKFTPEQQQAITLRNTNILVSAAAGSGKTAVLVERIIQRVTDAREPVDIDRLLVMTFTKAAAEQMRERILAAIEEKRVQNPFDRHLQKQATLVHNAKITTIHGFCLDVIRNHFHEIDLDPDFRVADEGECRLLKQDVLTQVLEHAYASGEEDFLSMTESLAAKKTDAALEDIILKLYGFSMSYPKQEEWLRACTLKYKEITAENFEDMPWIQELVKAVKLTTEAVLEKLRELLVQTEEEFGPYMYKQAILTDISQAEAILEAEGFHRLQKLFQSLTFDTLGREKKNGPAIDPEKKEAALALRNKCKKILQTLAADYFKETKEQVVEAMHAGANVVQALVELTLAFSRSFAEAKREKNIVDFNDLEHLCLAILENDKTMTAREYQAYFKEIYVDEYQDSNLVQETLLSLISKPEGEPGNVFLVGDVKQSIYRFRLARPSLFTDKYDSYVQSRQEPDMQSDAQSVAQSDKQAGRQSDTRAASGSGVRIDLHHNFRSRSDVLLTVNEIFRQIMQKELGNIAYDDAAALYYGADYPEDKCHQNESELLLLKKDEDIPDKELEARAIAGRIKELLKNQTVWDKKENCYRPLRYSDIVILLRTNRGWDETFQAVISEEGIPVHVLSQAGYFSAMEIKTILEYLRIIDNPLQDIPLAASMRSVLGNFTDEELALIRTENKAGRLYTALISYQGTAALNDKIHAFLEKLTYYREKASYTPVYELLLELIEGDYGTYILAMPQGIRRRANLNMLLKKAEDYGSTSYKGLFHFVRYIEFLQKYEIDFGEANLLDENADTVRIMSIHKSKGLEFPVCFLAGMSKSFNYQDARASLVLDVDYGIGIDRVDTVLRTKQATLLKKASAQKLISESLAEEMRIFYVALTRAEEKLIMTGLVRDVERKLSEEIFLTQAKSFLDFYLYARQKAGVQSVKLSQSGARELVEKEVHDAVDAETIREELLRLLQTGKSSCDTMNECVAMAAANISTAAAEKAALSEPDSPFTSLLSERLHFTYPYKEDASAFAKVSVSELKKRSMLMKALEDKDIPDMEKQLYEQPEPVSPVPAFIQKAEENLPARHGTAFHRMLELWDYKNEGTAENIQTYFAEAVEKQRMEQDLYASVKITEISSFLKTKLAARMAKAAALGCLYREQPFVIGIPGSLIQPVAEQGENVGQPVTSSQPVSDSQTAADTPLVSDAPVLVQGIIDAYFIEDGKIVVVDYKTDKVKKPEDLVERYRAQLNYYAYALSKLLGLEIKEKIIYSSRLEREIAV